MIEATPYVTVSAVIRSGPFTFRVMGVHNREMAVHLPDFSLHVAPVRPFIFTRFGRS